MKNQTVTVDEVLAFNIRRLRAERGLTQYEVLRRARRLGLQWSQATVARIENGKRRVTLTEWWLLPRVLDADLQDLAQLPPGATMVQVEGVVSTGAGFPLLATGQGLTTSPRSRKLTEVPSWSEPSPAEIALARRYGLKGVDATRRVLAAALGGAEHWAARTLGVSALEVAAASLSVWGVSLTDKRDQSLQGREGDLRAVRGHVTRRLLKEVEARVGSQKAGRTL